MISVCLGDKKRTSVHQVNKLLDAGLGKARLSIKKTASHEELSSALEKHFPKLKSAGGFEVLRAEGGGGGQRKLCLVHPAAYEYTATHLKDRLGQAVSYIHPLQCDLDEEPVMVEVTFYALWWKVNIFQVFCGVKCNWVVYLV